MSVYQIKSGDRVRITDRNIFYYGRIVQVLRCCVASNNKIFVLGFDTPAGGSVEMVLDETQFERAAS